MTHRLVKAEPVLTYIHPSTDKTQGDESDGDSVWFRPTGGNATFTGLSGPDGDPGATIARRGLGDRHAEQFDRAIRPSSSVIVPPGAQTQR